MSTISFGLYLAFSLFLNNVLADPPTSPFIPGATLDPGCAPTSTNCTVDPPLFGTTTLPIGGILYVNDSSGTITANTGFMYISTSTGSVGIGTSSPLSNLMVAGVPTQAATATLLLLGNNFIVGGSPSGTYFGVNAVSGSNVDYLNFQNNSSSLFRIASSGAVTITESTGTQMQILANSIPTVDLFHIANSATSAVTSTGINNLESDYFGGAAAVEAANVKLTVTAGGTSGGIWDALRIVENTTTQAGVNEIGIKIDPITNATGTESAIYIGSGWERGLVLAATPIGQATTSLIQLSTTTIQSGNSASGTYIGSNPAAFGGDFFNLQVNSTTEFLVSATGSTLLAGNLKIGGTLNVTSTATFQVTSTALGAFTVGTSTAVGGSFLTIGSSTNVVTVSKSGVVTIPNNTAGGLAVGTNTLGSFLFQVASTSNIFTVSKGGFVDIPSTASGTGLAIATTTQFGSSTLTVCFTSNCTTPTTATGSATVAFFASTAGTTTSTSIVARGVVTSGLTDVGEFIPVDGTDTDYIQGEVVAANLNATSSVSFQQSTSPYQTGLAGVITTTAGLVAGGGEDGHGSTVIALAGRVPVNVTMKNGEIHAGDFLTSSDIPGVAMRATQPGRVIGMALENDLGDAGNPNATSQVMMFVNPGWSLGSITSTQDIANSLWALQGMSGGQSTTDQFTAYVQAALAKLGLVIRNGIATIQELVAHKVTTDELCVQDICINGAQLSNILNSTGGSGEPAPATDPTSTADIAPSSTASSSDAAPAPAPQSADPSSTDASSSAGD